MITTYERQLRIRGGLWGCSLRARLGVHSPVKMHNRNAAIQRATFCQHGQSRSLGNSISVAQEIFNLGYIFFLKSQLYCQAIKYCSRWKLSPTRFYWWRTSVCGQKYQCYILICTTFPRDMDSIQKEDLFKHLFVICTLSLLWTVKGTDIPIGCWRE